MFSLLVLFWSAVYLVAYALHGADEPVLFFFYVIGALLMASIYVTEALLETMSKTSEKQLS